MMDSMRARDKKSLLIGALCVLMYCLYIFVAEPAYNRQMRINKQIETKSLFLSKYSELLQRRPYYEQKQKDSQEKSALLAKQFFAEDQPALAAAALQKILEDSAREASVTITSTRMEKAKYIERLLAVPVEIHVQSTLKNLSRLMFLIENHEKLLVIEEFNIQRTSRKDNDYEELKTKLIVIGFLKSLEPEKAKKAS
jgi:DNA-binding TFAR19-related protein (PDSD5 family)